MGYTNIYSQTRKAFDEGLRNYILKVYNYMAIGLLLSGITAASTISFPPLVNLVFNVNSAGQIVSISSFGNLMTFVPLGIALFFFFGFASLTVEKAKLLFWVYSVANGVSLSLLGLIYTGESLMLTFFICAAVFGAMSLYGYTTKRDLTSLGSFLMMGLVGLIVISLVNLFVHSTSLDLTISFVGVLIFMGILAWDTQKIKSTYYSVGGGELGQKMAVLSAFNLYLDIINLFLYLVRFFGVRKSGD